MADLLNFFPKVLAQSADAIAQPTFGNINISSGGTTTSTILLNSASTSTTVGERFKVRVEIKTNSVTISEYKIIIDFDPTKLQVIDQDTATTGNQIKNLDTIFLAENPATDNTISNAGRITFIGSTADGNPLSINREVLEIDFQAQVVGATPIRIITGASGSQLLRQNGAGANFTANEISIQVAAASTGSGVTPTPNPVTPPPATGNGSTTPPPTTLPDTALEAGVGDLLVVAVSLLIIALGTKMTLKKKETRD